MSSHSCIPPGHEGAIIEEEGWTAFLSQQRPTPIADPSGTSAPRAAQMLPSSRLLLLAFSLKYLRNIPQWSVLNLQTLG